MASVNNNCKKGLINLTIKEEFIQKEVKFGIKKD